MARARAHVRGDRVTVVQLDPATVETIVQRTANRASQLVLDSLIELREEARAERAQGQPAPAAAHHDAAPERRLVDAQTLADALGCSRDCIYARSAELGGKRIGNGPRGRLRFDLDRAHEAWSARPHSKASRAPDTPAAPGRSAPRRRRRMGSGPELLPIKGSERP
ncbi:MAG: hypothetical protein KGJ86_06230 [Chloroflexota bacterium]|nr:hypothetical protein [Chloroflexota bacterium]